VGPCALVIDTLPLPGKGIDLRPSIGMHACTRKVENGHENRLNRFVSKNLGLPTTVFHTRDHFFKLQHSRRSTANYGSCNLDSYIGARIALKEGPTRKRQVGGAKRDWPTWR
jgi:hypothetical protein